MGAGRCVEVLECSFLPWKGADSALREDYINWSRREWRILCKSLKGNREWIRAVGRCVEVLECLLWTLERLIVFYFTEESQLIGYYVEQYEAIEV